MSRKKTKPPEPPPSIPERHAINIRLTKQELAPIDADLAEFQRTAGFKVTRGAYAKHAVISYPKLRRMERALLAAMTDDRTTAGPIRDFAEMILEGGK